MGCVKVVKYVDAQGNSGLQVGHAGDTKHLQTPQSLVVLSKWRSQMSVEQNIS